MKMDEVKSFVDLIENGIWMGKLVKITGEHSQAGSEGIVRNFIREEGEDKFALQVAVGGKLLPIESVGDIEILDSEITFQGEKPVRTRATESEVTAEGQVFEPVSSGENPNVVDPTTQTGQQIVDEAKEQMEISVKATEGENQVPDNLFEPAPQENDSRSQISKAIQENEAQRKSFNITPPATPGEQINVTGKIETPPNPVPDLTKDSPSEKVDSQTKDTAKADPKPTVKKADSAPKTVKH